VRAGTGSSALFTGFRADNVLLAEGGGCRKEPGSAFAVAGNPVFSLSPIARYTKTHLDRKKVITTTTREKILEKDPRLMGLETGEGNRIERNENGNKPRNHWNE